MLTEREEISVVVQQMLIALPSKPTPEIHKKVLELFGLLSVEFNAEQFDYIKDLASEISDMISEEWSEPAASMSQALLAGILYAARRLGVISGSLPNWPGGIS